MERPKPKTDDDFLTDPTDADRASFGRAFERLVGLMARLRGEGGCPWDRAQTLESLRPYLIEEAYEVLEAVDTKSVEHHLEELGDLLLQVVFHAEIRRQEDHFDASDVAHGIADKLVRRHPHVFKAEEAPDASAAFQRWEAVKSKEKAGRSVIAGVPKELPALLRAQRIGEKAANVGFDWNDLEGPLEKLEEEVGELFAAIEANDRDAIAHEIGDALFSLVNVARHLQITAEDALRASIDRFSRRFHHVETRIQEQGRSVAEASLDEMESYWQEAKQDD